MGHGSQLVFVQLVGPGAARRGALKHSRKTLKSSNLRKPGSHKDSATMQEDPLIKPSTFALEIQRTPSALNPRLLPTLDLGARMQSFGTGATAGHPRKAASTASTADVKFLRFMGPVEANIPAHYIARRGDSQALSEDLYPSHACGLLRKPGNQPESATTQETPSMIQMPVVESTALKPWLLLPPPNSQELQRCPSLAGQEGPLHLGSRPETQMPNI